MLSGAMNEAVLRLAESEDPQSRAMVDALLVRMLNALRGPAEPAIPQVITATATGYE